MQCNQTDSLAQKNMSKQTTALLTPTLDEFTLPVWPETMRDYVNAFVVNDAGEVLIIENRENGRNWGSWRVAGRCLAEGEDPVLAVQQDLRRQTGLVCSSWTYLGTFVLDEQQTEGAGHFFFAHQVTRVSSPQVQVHDNNIKWISKQELKQALLDGRIAALKNVVAICLALVLCE
ncbi:MAG: NUDIX domain-containing protein [Chloroflexota bacterium]